MIVVFDLDDTLYDEATYVEGGLLAASKYGESRFGWCSEQAFNDLKEILAIEGRGQVFDRWLALRGIRSKAIVKEFVKIYRHHAPVISLTPVSARVLTALEGNVPLYLVTDGHKVVQANKVAALHLENRFTKVLLTHRYGRSKAKPSTHCFELIKAAERCTWQQMVYVGDNPAKDFVGLNRVGMPTVRLLSGRHRGDIASPGHEALHRISSLDELIPLLELLDGNV